MNSLSFKKYQVYIPHVVLVVLTIIIVFVLIIPQISVINDKQSMLSAQKNRVSMLNNSVNAVSLQSSTALDTDLDIATTALPTKKDITQIFSALTQAANASNTTLGTFSVEVGGVYGRAALESSAVGVPFITVTVHIENGTPQSQIAFAQALSQTLPLSEITKIDISGKDAVYQINFFYKPLDETKIAKQENVTSLTQSDTDLLNQLNAWKK